VSRGAPCHDLTFVYNPFISRQFVIVPTNVACSALGPRVGQSGVEPASGGLADSTDNESRYIAMYIKCTAGDDFFSSRVLIAVSTTVSAADLARCYLNFVL